MIIASAAELTDPVKKAPRKSMENCLLPLSGKRNGGYQDKNVKSGIGLLQIACRGKGQHSLAGAGHHIDTSTAMVFLPDAQAFSLPRVEIDSHKAIINDCTHESDLNFFALVFLFLLSILL